MKKTPTNKKLIVFDLDGTLAPSKSVIDSEMEKLLKELLSVRKVAVIGGGKYALFQQQLLERLHGSKELFARLFLFPTTSTAFYRYERGKWKNIYKLELTPRDRKKIVQTFNEVFKEIGYQHPVKTYGKVIEDRRTQVTFSALGQEIVAVLGPKGVRMKDEWKEKNTPIKLKIAKLMQKKLPHLEVRAAGHTSVDVTRKGIDKAYGLKQIEKHLHVPIRDMLFIGDAIFPGGNDYAIVRTRVQYVKVKDPKDTKKVIRDILKAAAQGKPKR